jgi:hypothetical protein
LIVWETRRYAMERRAMTRARMRIASAAIGAMLLVGCGSEEEQQTDGPLGDALADVSISGDGAADVTWVDVPAMLDAAGLSPSSEAAVEEPRWQTPVGLAQGEQFVASSGADLGFDPLSGERTISVGTPPDQATRYDGVDADAARDSFERMGFEETSTDNGDFLALGDEGEVAVPASGESGQAPLGINRGAIDGDTVVFGAYEQAVAGALGGSPPLSEQPGFAAAADCLGSDAFAARIVDPEGTASEEVALIGVGLSAPEGDAVPETVCAIGASGGSIDSVADCMKKGFAGPDPYTAQPIPDLLGEAEVDTGESGGSPWARASFRPPTDRPVGVVFDMLEKGSLGQVLGGFDPATALGSGATPAQIDDLKSRLGDCAPA